jgi:sorting nexin-25
VSIGESYDVNDEGKDFALYPIQVTRVNSDGLPSGWVIAKRYSQFHALHQALRTKYPQTVGSLEMPGKMINGLMKLRKQFMENRRQSLEKYLSVYQLTQSLLKYEDICRTPELRKFICHPDITRLLYSNEELDASASKRSFLKSIFHTTDESSDSSRRRSIFNINISQVSDERVSPDTAMDSPDTVLLSNDASVASATAAITDLLIELFELREKNNWLRRQAVVILLKQLFGDTVERRTTETLSWVAGRENALFLLERIRDTYWPNGEWNTNWPTRSEETKNRTRQTVRSKFLQLAKQFGAVFGKQNSVTGALRWFHAFQNRRLNRHLLYTILDELLMQLFPALKH